MAVVTQVLDGTFGRSAAGIRAFLRRGNGSTWTTIAEAETDAYGQINDWRDWRLEHGLYRIVFDSDNYFATLGVDSVYREVTVTFRIQSESMKFQVQLTISPYSYYTYFGIIED